ncbi:MAG: fumarylacetoacetate hydrolase family protein [Phycisphaeraceae bacterium]
MRIIRFIDDTNTIRFGHQLDADFADLLSDSPLLGGKPTGEHVTIQKLLCPIIPTAIYCIGLNYRKHAEETGAELPRWPVLFMKNPGAINHPGDPIVLPACSTGPEVDYECELAVVIGRAAKNVPESRALDYVLGYTVANDVSARRWQKHSGGGQWVRGKSFDSFCPFGPAIVTSTPRQSESSSAVLGSLADYIPDPQSLALRTTLNGDIMQDANTNDMIFTVAQLIAELSKDMTLLAGSILLTGTPSGVGVARNPPVFLQPGDTVTCSIQGLGELTNPVE